MPLDENNFSTRFKFGNPLFFPPLEAAEGTFPADTLNFRVYQNVFAEFSTVGQSPAPQLYQVPAFPE